MRWTAWGHDGMSGSSAVLHKASIAQGRHVNSDSRESEQRSVVVP